MINQFKRLTSNRLPTSAPRPLQAQPPASECAPPRASLDGVTPERAPAPEPVAPPLLPKVKTRTFMRAVREKAMHRRAPAPSSANDELEMLRSSLDALQLDASDAPAPAPDFIDSVGRRWLHPDYAKDKNELAQAFASEVAAGAPGTLIEARAYGDAYGKPLEVTRFDAHGNAAHEVIYSGDEAELFWSRPLRIKQLSGGGWAVPTGTHEHVYNGADGLYIALQHAACLARRFGSADDFDCNQAALCVKDVRNNVARRLMGFGEVVSPFQRDRQMIQEGAKLLGMQPALVPYPKWSRDKDAAYLAPSISTQDAVRDVAYLPERGWVVFDKPAGAPANIASLAGFKVIGAALTAHQALQALAALRGIDVNGWDDVYTQLETMGAERCMSSAPGPISDLYLTAIAAAAASATKNYATLLQSPQGAAEKELFVAKAEAFEAHSPYRVFRDASEERVARAYIAHTLTPRAFGTDIVARAIGQYYGVNVRVWSPTADASAWACVDARTHWVENAQHTMDFLNSRTHYQLLDKNDAVAADARAASVSAEYVQAHKVDAGGGGDCLWLSAAFALNVHSFRNVYTVYQRYIAQGRQDIDAQAMRQTMPAALTALFTDAHTPDDLYKAFATSVVQTMRREICAMWEQSLTDATRAQHHEARSLVDGLVMAASDEGANTVENALYAWEPSSNPAVVSYRIETLSKALVFLPDANDKLRASAQRLLLREQTTLKLSN